MLNGTKFVTLMLLTLSRPCAAQNSAQLDPPLRDLMTFERDIETATARGDVAFVSNALADDFTFTHGDEWRTGAAPGRVDTKKSWIDLVTRGLFTSREVDSQRVEPHGSTAITTGRITVKLNAPTSTRREYSVWFIRVYRAKGNSWELVSHRTVGESISLSSAGLLDFATRYAAAWSGKDPVKFGSFYDRNGALLVNGAASIGRDEVIATARSYMAAFPDMVVKLDSLRQENGQTVFHWTWTGTNTGPGGTGKAVNLHGYERWTIGSNGLITKSDGHFDNDEYQRQLKGGAESSPQSPATIAPVGTWRGTSVCLVRQSACKDEIVVYRIAPANARDTLTIDARKIVNGEEQEMGVLRCRFTPATASLTCALPLGTWKFRVQKDSLIGELRLSDNTKFRDVRSFRAR